MLTSSNAGPNTAKTAVITDWVPKGATFVSASDPFGACSTKMVQTQLLVTCQLGDLPANSNATIGLTFTATGTSGANINDDSPKTSSNTTDPNTANNGTKYSVHIN